MFARNTMVRLLLLTLILSASAANAVTTVPLSATAGVRTDYTEPSSMFAILTNVYKQASGSLSSEDQKQHIKTVIFAASTLETGSVAEWTNPANATAGRVKVVMTKPVQGGYCRMLFTQVEKDNVIRDYTEWACKTIDSKFWTFSER
jgi:surface antigen